MIKHDCIISNRFINTLNRRFKMKTLLVGITIVSVLALGTLAFAHGFGGWGGGNMMGQGYGGGHMMGPGYGGHMGGWASPGYGTGQTDQKFLDKTADLRKDLHDKRFEYFESRRDPGTTTKTLAKLEKEIYELQEKIYEDAPRTPYRDRGGYGHCF
jgi:hypothetical protein